MSLPLLILVGAVVYAAFVVVAIYFFQGTYKDGPR